MAKKLTERQKNWQGSKWIRREKRLAIYMRDGLACCYCGDGIEDGAQLTLDHLTPHSHGGENTAANLVTCCHRCNSSRGNRCYREFAEAVASYLNHGIQAADIVAHIETTITRPLDVPAPNNSSLGAVGSPRPYGAERRRIMARYKNIGDIRGECPHAHRTLTGLYDCWTFDQNACSRQGGYSDRQPHQQHQNGSWIPLSEAERDQWDALTNWRTRRA